jgi:serine/threonine-protein kinase
VSLEHFKTQVLLLHSEQSTLDALSTGFSDRYSVHLATSGTEALNTLGDTPIHVIVFAQDLPGMSGLEALREAKKRSPDTIGILLAGTNADDGLEALVDDQEVFRIVRGAISPAELQELIDNATRRVRLIALSESANDQAANPDEPADEYIVMETAEDGSPVISDGTGRMPAIKPTKAEVLLDVGGRQVDILVLTKDDGFLSTIRDSARGLHNVHHANTPKQANEIVREHKVGVLITDAAMADSNIEILTQSLRASAPRLVAIVAGRRDDGELLMDLINRGQVYRFLLKPVSPGRARLAIEASVKFHLEASDSSFLGKPKAAATAELSKTASGIKPRTRAAPAATVAELPTPITALRDSGRLPEPAAPKGAMSVTTADIAKSVAESLPSTSSVILRGVGTLLKSAANAFSRLLVDATALLRRPRNLAIVGGFFAVIAVGYWFATNPESQIPEPGLEEATNTPTMVEPNVPMAEPNVSMVDAIPPVSEPPIDVNIEELLDEARQAQDSGQIFSPPGSNAVEHYLAALSLAPGNPVVAVELANTINQILGMIETALLEQRTDDAAEALQMVRLADPENSRLAFLEAQLLQLQFRTALARARAAIQSGEFEDASTLIGSAAALRTGDISEINILKQELSTARSAQRVDEVLALANARLNENKLITPSNDNARHYYELALGNDPQNPAAQQGMTIIAGKLVLQAREAIDKEQFTQADNLLREAETLDPLSTELATSRAALDEARARREDERQAAARRAAEAKQREEAERQAAEERQAELKRQLEAEAERQAAEEKQAELKRQLEAEAERQAAEEKQAELKRQLEAEAERQAAARLAAASATANQAAAAQDVLGSASAGDRAKKIAGAADSGTTASASENTAAAIEPPVNPENEATENTLLAAATEAEEMRAPVSAQAEGAGSNQIAMSQLVRTNYVAPKYPRSAQRRNTSGWVDLSFGVARDGSVHSIEIIESTPGSVFDDAATKAVSQWRFEPVMENGVPVEKRTAVRMMFSLQ